MGETSLALFDLVGRNNHLVIEADSRNWALARHMFDLNQKDVRIKFGILFSGGSAVGEIAFASHTNASSSSAYNREGSETVEHVPAFSFEQVIDADRATQLELDIEGGEYELFVQARSLGSLRRIILEAHPDIIGEARMSEMLSALKANGFEQILNHNNSRFLILDRPA